MTKMEGGKWRGRPELRCTDGVKTGAEMKGLNMKDARMFVHDRDRCRRVVDFERMWDAKITLTEVIICRGPLVNMITYSIGGWIQDSPATETVKDNGRHAATKRPYKLCGVWVCWCVVVQFHVSSYDHLKLRRGPCVEISRVWARNILF